MKIEPINNITYKSNKKDTQNNEITNRLITMGSGIALGTIGGMIYYHNKNYKGLKFWVHSIEIGAFVGLASDIIRMCINIPDNIKSGKIQKYDLQDIEPYKSKDFFKALYTGNSENIKDFKKYEQRLENKNFCKDLFNNEAVLQASKEALIELNNAKINEYETSNNQEAVKYLYFINSILSFDKTKDTSNIQNKRKNVSFNGIWDIFTEGGEGIKKRAEISVNRYATSAAATAATLANTGFGDTLALTIITKNMCKKIFKIYNCNGGYTAAISAAAVGSVLGTNLATKGATMFPGAGNALNATITYSLHQLEGRALIEFLEEYQYELSGMSDADAVSKFAYRVKQGIKFIKNDKVRDVVEKIIDKGFDFFL